MPLFRGKGARKDAVRGTTPIEVRKAESAYWASTGVVPGGASPLVTGTAGWAYSVGAAHFVTSRSVADGHQVYGNDGAVTIGATGVGSTVPVAPGSGLSRIDIMWTRHPTNLENADTSSEPLFGVASGIAGAPGLPPTIPTGAQEIGRNTMGSTATSTSSSGNSISQTAAVALLRGSMAGVRFRGTIPAGTAITGGVAMAFTVAEDTHAGWNAATKTWTAPVAGTYLITAMIRCDVTGIAGQYIVLDKNGPILTTSPTLPSASFSGTQISRTARLAAGEAVRMYVGASYTTGDNLASNNWLEITQVQG